MGMPFTPFHFGIALPLILWDWKKKRVDAVSALIGTVIVDIRATYLFLFTNNTNYHGFLHSFLSATMLGLVVGLGVHLTRRFWKYPLKFLKFDQNTTLFSKIITAIILANSHVLLDAALYPEMNLFWPFLGGNPLYQWQDPIFILDLCIDGFLIGVLLYIGFLIWHFATKNKTRNNQRQE